ncbi:MAG: mechanosensitive ion channel family protein [Paludibacter sp.]|nr:mechanosensitive ion channel family protein [Paludibacter sp.]
MKKLYLFFLLFLTLPVLGQNDSLSVLNDSVNQVVLKNYQTKIAEIEEQRLSDSVKKAELQIQLNSLKTTDNLQKQDLINQLKTIEKNESIRVAEKRARINQLRSTATGSPVTGVMNDTLFLIYSKIGAATPVERAMNISIKIKKLYNDDFLKPDSITVVQSENTYDIVYGEMIIMSVSESDGLWYDQSTSDLTANFSSKIKQELITAKSENSFLKLLMRIGLVMLVFGVVWAIIWFAGRGYKSLLAYIENKKSVWLKDLSYRDYTFLSTDQELNIILFIVKASKWLVYVLILYITLPVIFSIFPFSRNWADTLFQLIWSPFRKVLTSVWHYLPNLFSILVIYFVMRYVIKFVRYIFREIETDKLKISGFHADWAMPTYHIVRFLLYAFMFVLIFPYLPGSDSSVFKGVSVFLGVLFSLGSSSAIANIIAGMVITYMRPFKIGDRIKIGEVSGDVIEKTMLVTRIRTIKNEIVTIPNSSVLTGNTTNYTSEADTKGLILHTTVTIGYDVPWNKMHEALLEAANRTDMALKKPKPFVLQTSLDDFYVSYQLNVYTHEASKQALIYSALHQHTLDVCNERGIEIMSPHYRAERDGNRVAIPDIYQNKEENK